MRISARRIAAVTGAVILIGVIVWIDVRTTVWNELVILSGLAAGLVTFLLTVLVIDRVLERSNTRRWEPVTRLALTEILHGLADEERSEPTRGVIVVRRLVTPVTSRTGPAARDDLLAQSHLLRVAVVAERTSLAATLGTWSSFLASSSGSTGIMRRIAEATLQLEAVRDASLDYDATLEGAQIDAHCSASDTSGSALAQLQREVTATNTALRAIADDIVAQLSSTAQ